MSNIQDFGKKIGGARKDLWQSRGIIHSDLTDMNALERKTHIKKDNIWLRPDWVQLVKNGTPQGVAFWQNSMRQAIPPRPETDSEVAQENYISVVSQIRDAVMAIRTPQEVENFYRSYLHPTFIQPESRGYYVRIIPEAAEVISNKLLRVAQSHYRSMQRKAEDKLFAIPKDEKVYTAVKKSLSVHRFDGEDAYFKQELQNGQSDPAVLLVKVNFGHSFYYLQESNPFSDASQWEQGSYFVIDQNKRCPLAINLASREEALAFVEQHAQKAQEEANKSGKSRENMSSRKGAFTPPQLRRISREGPDYRHGRFANSNLFLQELKFRGGEFGNWLSENDRQANLNMAYDAFRDLSRLIQIRPEDVALSGSLAIAFGARGRGGSGAGAAHYEPDRQVINLTKMSGAGCLAHEWGHALDHAIGIALGSTDLATEMKSFRNAPQGTRTITQALTDLMDSMKYKRVLVQPEEMRDGHEKEIARCKENLGNWFSSVKPKSLPEELEKAWNDTTDRIIASASSYTGREYLSAGPAKAKDAKPDIEILSQIRKRATNHVIPKDTKIQFTLWARDLGRAEEKLRALEPQERRVQTDFYRGSVAFDGAYSKAGHGYWQSTCEMFARAFDCYIWDKMQASGCRSDYLSSHANAYVMQGKDGQRISAVPTGDERTRLNECFDKLITAMKEQELLHEHKEDLTKIMPPEDRVRRNSVLHVPIPSAPLKSEQLSFDDLLQDAEARSKTGTSCASIKPQDLTR